MDAPPAPVDDGEDSSQIGDDDIDFGKKKKKKKKKAFDIDAAEAAQADEGVESVVADGGEITGWDIWILDTELKQLSIAVYPAYPLTLAYSYGHNRGRRCRCR